MSCDHNLKTKYTQALKTEPDLWYARYVDINFPTKPNPQNFFCNLADMLTQFKTSEYVHPTL